MHSNSAKFTQLGDISNNSQNIPNLDAVRASRTLSKKRTVSFAAKSILDSSSKLSLSVSNISRSNTSNISLSDELSKSISSVVNGSEYSVKAPRFGPKLPHAGKSVHLYRLSKSKNHKHDKDSNEIVTQLQGKHRQESNPTITEDSGRSMAFTNEANGKRTKWIATYDIKSEELSYPSLKYLDVVNDNNMFLANQILTSESKYFEYKDEIIKSKNKNTENKPVELTLLQAFNMKYLNQSNSQETEKKSKAYHDFEAPYYHAETAESPDKMNFDSSNIHKVKPLVPIPRWTLEISDIESKSNPSSESSSSSHHGIQSNDKTSQSGSKTLEKIDCRSILDDGEKKLKENMLIRHEAHLGDIVKHKQVKKLKKYGTPIIGHDNMAKSPKSIRRLEREEDEVYYSLKTSEKSQSIRKSTFEEQVYNEEKDKLYPMLLTKDAYAMEGLLYYRVRNRLHEKDKEKSLARIPLTSTSSTATNHNILHHQTGFERKLRNSLALLDAPIRGNDSLESLPQSLSSEALQSFSQDVSDMTITRLKRAIRASVNGYNYHALTDNLENPSDDESLGNSFADSDDRPDRGIHLKKSSVFSQDSLMNSLSQSQYQSIVNKRYAQDILTLSQLKNGILPEQLIKKNIYDDNILIDLSHYDIGNTNGKCLAIALKPLDTLQSLSLHDNHLSSETISEIIDNLTKNNLQHLDISRNKVHGIGCRSISEFLYQSKLSYLNLSFCEVDCEDLKTISKAIVLSRLSSLRQLFLSNNNISTNGINSFYDYLSQSNCSLEVLDLSWNKIDAEGANLLAQSLKKNTSLKILYLGMNIAMNDIGGQEIASSLSQNRTIEEIYLNQTNLKHATCFIFAQVLRYHPSMRILDLSSNPVGEAGARCLFRTLLRGIPCKIDLKDCEYALDERLFNHSFPAENSPYYLNLSDPYDSSVLAELMSMAEDDPINCRFTSVIYTEDNRRSILDNIGNSKQKANNENKGNKMAPSSSSRGQTLKLTVLPEGYISDRSGGPRWVPPSQGMLTVHFDHTVVMPTIDDAISSESLSILADILSSGRTDLDKKNWLRMICHDIYCTTNQAEELIYILRQRKVISDDSLSRLDILKCVWCRLVDQENLFDFMVRNLDTESRRQLIYALSFDNFKFNWLNATSHWRFNLADKYQRYTMQQIVAINYYESEYSRNNSKRGDTSQWGNWYNFRNIRFNNISEDIVLDRDFLNNIPRFGIIEFDYVSTTRPKYRDTLGQGSESRKESALPDLSSPTRIMTSNLQSDGSSQIQNISIDDMDSLFELSDSISSPTATYSSINRKSSRVPFNVTTNQDSSKGMRSSHSRSSISLNQILLPNPSTSMAATKLITESDFIILLQKLNLRRSVANNHIHTMDNASIPDIHIIERVPKTNALMILLELQHAVAKYYFPCTAVIQLLDYFALDAPTQAKVVICLFSRIWDLHNFDFIMRCFRDDNGLFEAQQIIMNKLGCLNIVNPLKPNLKFNLFLKYFDNRILLHSLLEISASDCTEQLIVDQTSDLTTMDLYGSTARLLSTEERYDTMKFIFAEVGERSINVNWNVRKDQLKRYLVGDAACGDRSIYRIISMYKEIEKEGLLSKGPVETQYFSYLKTMRSNSRQARSSVSSSRRVSTGPGFSNANGDSKK